MLLALVLTPASETASAHPSHPVATVLLPGYNLAGWIEPEAGVAELFEAIPELEAVYAWDAAEQRYRGSTGPGAGDLTTLTPGMGLWLDIVGDEPVPWIRSAAPDPATGLVTLREGWNLVAWYGGENESFEHAFATLDAGSQAVLAWDAERQWFSSYLPGAPAGGEQVVRVGDAVWVSSPGERRWLQPGSVVPRVEFYGEFLPERKAEIRAETLSVVTWFAERYGLLEPEFVLFVGADRESFDQARREILGIQDPPYVLCGVAVNELVFLADWCATATHDLTSPIAHEYFHVLQTHLVERTPTTETIYVADWLLEGTAEHVAYAYAIAQGQTTAEEVAQAFQRDVVEDPAALDVLGVGGTGISQLDTVGYLAAAFAVQYLVDQTDEAAVIEFFELLPSMDGWEAAFTKAFGLSPAAFSSALSDHAESLRPPPVPLRTVHVTVNGPDGNPIWEWNELPLKVGAYHHNVETGEDYYSPLFDVGETGAVMRIPDGAHGVSVTAACTILSGNFFRSIYYELLGWYTTDGSYSGPAGNDVLVVAGQDLSIAINLGDWPNELNINCHIGDRFRIAGRVVNEAGEVRRDYRLSASAEGDVAGLLSARTDHAGAFSFEAPDGYGYLLAVYDACERALGYYNEDEGLVGTQLGEGLWGLMGDGRDRTVISVNGAAVSGIEIVVPSSVVADQGC